MKVIGHQHIAVQRNMVLAQAFAQHRAQRLVICRIDKDRLAVVPALDGVMHEAGNGQARQAGHETANLA